MTGAQITGVGQSGTEVQWRVTCAEHDLDRTVDTQQWATNLAQKHDREQHADAVAAATGVSHPGVINLAAAAGYLMVCHADRLDGPNEAHAYASYSAALDMWEALVGLTGEPALDYARAIRDTATRAAVVPF